MNINLNKDLLIKVAGIGLAVAGTIVTSISTKNDNDKTLEKLVNEKLTPKN